MDGWFLSGNDKRVEYKAVLNTTYLKAAGFWDETKRQVDQDSLDKAAAALQRELAMKLPGDGGYVCSLELKYPENTSLAEYVTWSDWIWEDAPDLLTD